MSEIVKPKCQILTDFNQGNGPAFIPSFGAPLTRPQFVPAKGIAIFGAVFKLISTCKICCFFFF